MFETLKEPRYTDLILEMVTPAYRLCYEFEQKSDQTNRIIANIINQRAHRKNDLLVAEKRIIKPGEVR